MSIPSASFILYVGLDVHKDSVTAAVFRGRDPEPMRVDRLPYDLKKLRRYFQRLQAEGEVRACYEASGAGYVLQRSLKEWGVACELAAPSLIPRRPGEQRKTDERDAIKLGRGFKCEPEEHAATILPSPGPDSEPQPLLHFGPVSPISLDSDPIASCYAPG